MTNTSSKYYEIRYKSLDAISRVMRGRTLAVKAISEADAIYKLEIFLKKLDSTKYTISYIVEQPIDVWNDIAKCYGRTE